MGFAPLLRKPLRTLGWARPAGLSRVKLHFPLCIGKAFSGWYFEAVQIAVTHHTSNSFVHLFKAINDNSCFIQWAIMCDYPFSSDAQGKLEGALLAGSVAPMTASLLFEFFLTSWHRKGLSRSVPGLTLESAISPRKGLILSFACDSQVRYNQQLLYHMCVYG